MLTCAAAAAAPSPPRSTRALSSVSFCVTLTSSPFLLCSLSPCSRASLAFQVCTAAFFRARVRLCVRVPRHIFPLSAPLPPRFAVPLLFAVPPSVQSSAPPSAGTPTGPSQPFACTFVAFACLCLSLCVRTFFLLLRRGRCRETRRSPSPRFHPLLLSGLLSPLPSSVFVRTLVCTTRSEASCFFIFFLC